MKPARAQLLAIRALAAQVAEAADELEEALKDPARHDPIYSAANRIRENLEACVSTYSDRLNGR